MVCYCLVCKYKILASFSNHILSNLRAKMKTEFRRFSSAYGTTFDQSHHTLGVFQTIVFLKFSLLSILYFYLTLPMPSSSSWFPSSSSLVSMTENSESNGMLSAGFMASKRAKFFWWPIFLNAFHGRGERMAVKNFFCFNSPLKIVSKVHFKK